MSRMIQLINESMPRPDGWRTEIAGVKHLYLHIPFCHRRCAYCDFNTYANMDDRMAAYVDALCSELAACRRSDKETPDERHQTRDTRRETPDTSQGADCQSPVSGLRSPVSPSPLLPVSATLTRADLRPTIFLGGGTPSMLPLELMEQVLGAANELIGLAGAEVTVEANPGTVLGRDYLRGLRGLGVNRLSMGVQSLHDPTLRVLGRIHTAAEARQSYEDARRAGFENVNLDFIFGLPGQTVEQWDATLREIATWGADHFSLYSLILEEKTPLYAQVLGGRLSVPDEDATAEMYERAIERLGAAGYVQYEISNWARDENQEPRTKNQEVVVSSVLGRVPSGWFSVPRWACHHNLAYWLNADYLACGAGAHGHLFPRRYSDVLGIDEYIGRVRAGQSPIAEITELSRRDLAAETMFMGLRLNTGVSYEHFRDRCGVELGAIYGDELAELAAQGLLERDDSGVRLTERGRMLGNQVFGRFV